jgi:hypothetical protein
MKTDIIQSTVINNDTTLFPVTREALVEIAENYVMPIEQAKDSNIFVATVEEGTALMAKKDEAAKADKKTIADLAAKVKSSEKSLQSSAKQSEPSEPLPDSNIWYPNASDSIGYLHTGLCILQQNSSLFDTTSLLFLLFLHLVLYYGIPVYGGKEYVVGKPCRQIST